jgi:hypothetical protein
MRKYILSLWLGSIAIAGGQKSTTLEAVRAYVLSYYQDLPDYTCVQETDRRFTRESDFLTMQHLAPGLYAPPPGFDTHSEIEEELSFVGGKETYKVTQVNGVRAANIPRERLGGTTSSGEYGSLLHHIFDPDTGTSFQSAAPTKLQGRMINVFTFRVPQAKGYTIYDGELKREFLLAYEGSVYADAETNVVMRIMMKCVEFPSETRFTAVELTLDYRPTQLSNRKFILPSHFTLVWRKRKNETTNPIQFAEAETNTGDFKRYHRFKADSTIEFVNNENSRSGQSENGRAKK